MGVLLLWLGKREGGDGGGEGGNQGADPPAVHPLPSGTRQEGTDDETNSRAGPFAGVAAQLAGPQPH